MEGFVSFIDLWGDIIFDLMLAALLVVFGVAAFSLEREAAIISFLLCGLSLSLIFVRLNAVLLGVFQLSVFAGLALVLLFYQRARVLHATSKHQTKIAVLLLALFLVFLIQFSVVSASVIPASSVWLLRAGDVIMLAVFSFSVALGLAALRRWKNVR